MHFLSGNCPAEFTDEAWLLLRIASLDTAAIVRDYREAAVRSLGVLKWQSILSSLLHMHVNRAFSEDWRRQELCCYEFLSRAYGELHHRSRGAATTG